MILAAKHNMLKTVHALKNKVIGNMLVVVCSPNLNTCPSVPANYPFK